MKKILFVLQSARSGGSTTSLLNLINVLDKNKLDINAFFMEQDGIFLKDFQKNCHVLPEEKIIASITYKKDVLREKNVSYTIIRFIFVILHRIFGKKKILEIFYKLSAKKFSNRFDAVVAFQEDKVTEYVQFIDAPQKIAWVHCDYDRFAVGKEQKYENELYKKYQEIVCVSNYAKSTMLSNLDIDDSKIYTIYNTIAEKQIRKMSYQDCGLKIDSDNIFVSVGRLVPIKDFKKIIYVSKKLISSHIDFKWILVGDGEEYNVINEMIEKYGLSEKIIMVGNQKNPYAYMRISNYYVCTSICETHPMVVLEALTLGIPVISTDYPSVHEIIDDKVNGYICDNNVDALYNLIMEIVNNKNYSKEIIDGANAFVYDNSKCTRELYKILGV